jgi:hypothetical protein
MFYSILIRSLRAMTFISLLLGSIGFIGSAYAAPRLCDDGSHPPCQIDGGGGGGNAPPDFGDLIILYRDMNGVPYLTADDCWQPIPSETCTAECTLVAGFPAGQMVIPVDPETCAITAACAACSQEVDFGRINEARSSDAVFESQLEDAVVNLATADCMTLDPAGRLVTSRVVDGTVLTNAIDSPLQNLAIYRQLILSGYLGAETSPLELPASALDTAARGFGAASDKAGEVNLDMVVYLNQIMGLADRATLTILEPKTCINMKEEVAGQVKLVEKCFLNYGAYTYNRAGNFSTLPDPAYIPAAAPVEGWFEYLAQLPGTEPPLFQIMQGPVTTAVFTDAAGYLNGNIGGFAQAADDTRAVIDFMHSNPVPGDFATPVPCVASGDITYDVSISEVSGLQVPVRMVAGTEGREFTVTVNNESSSPDAASGTVTVTAEDANGFAIPGFPRIFAFTDLLPGTNAYWTEGFSIDYKTTVTWTATAEADFDVNPGNNSVTETTQVTGGGGGRH